jgi:hypothetical protein
MADLVPNYDELEDDELIGEDETDDEEFEIETEPSYTYAINWEQNAVMGYIDELDAIRQAVILMLEIERYDHSMFSWDYGSELKQLIGMPMDYCIPEVERLISEVLLEDDRIEAVDQFVFEPDKRRLKVSFTVHSAYGDTEMETEIDV